MAMIDDPNQTTLEGLIRKADVVNPRHPGYMEENKPTSGFFPTGEFMGMPVSKGIQDLIGQIALLGIGGIGSIAKKGASKAINKIARSGQSLRRGARDAISGHKLPQQGSQYVYKSQAERLRDELLGEGLDSFQFQNKLRELESINPEMAYEISSKLF